MFCANCGAVLKHCSKFCHVSGQKVENDIVSGNETDKGATKCLSFKSYAAKKSERSTHFRSSGSKKRGQKRKEGDPFALINVGIMGFISI